MGRPRKKNRYLVDEHTGCWIWQLCIKSGYGECWDGSKVKGAHIVEYERRHGPVPDGMELDHLCRNRSCVNPDHLEPVTKAENIRRGLNAKLSKEEVEQIKKLYDGGLSQATIAEMFPKVSESAIGSLVRGVTWSNTPGRTPERNFRHRCAESNKRLGDDEVRNIHRRHKNRESYESLAKVFGVTGDHIRAIVCGRRRRSIFQELNNEHCNGSSVNEVESASGAGQTALVG